MTKTTPENTPKQFAALYDAWPLFADWYSNQQRHQKPGPAEIRPQISKAISLFRAKDSRYPQPHQMVKFMTACNFATIGTVRVKIKK